MKKKIIKRTLLVLLWTVIIIGACIFPYPALFMANSLPKQPELSTNEKNYFDRLKKEMPWSKISRMYMNIDSLGEDIMIRNIPIDFSSKYTYTISLTTENVACYYANYTPKNAETIAKQIKDSICLNSPNLIEIYISITYKDTIEDSRKGMYRLYQFSQHGDSLNLLPYRKD